MGPFGRGWDASASVEYAGGLWRISTNDGSRSSTFPPRGAGSGATDLRRGSPLGGDGGAREEADRRRPGRGSHPRPQARARAQEAMGSPAPRRSAPSGAERAGGLPRGPRGGGRQARRGGTAGRRSGAAPSIPPAP